MTLGEMAQSIAQEYGEFYEDPEVKDQFLRWAVEAYQEVYGSGPWYFRNRTVETDTDVGTGRISIATVFGPIRLVTVRSVAGSPPAEYTALVGRPIIYVPVERIVARPGTNIYTDLGPPKFWFYQEASPTGPNTVFQIYPAPEYELGLDLHTMDSTPAISENFDLALPPEFLPLVAYAIRRRVLQNDGNKEMAAVFQAEYDRLHNQLLLSFTGPMGESSRLPVKRIKAVHQAPLAQGAGA